MKSPPLASQNAGAGYQHGICAKYDDGGAEADRVNGQFEWASAETRMSEPVTAMEGALDKSQSMCVSLFHLHRDSEMSMTLHVLTAWLHHVAGMSITPEASLVLLIVSSEYDNMSCIICASARNVLYKLWPLACRSNLRFSFCLWLRYCSFYIN